MGQTACMTSGPQPSKRKRLSDYLAQKGWAFICDKGLEYCELDKGGWECMDTASDIESCGGCPGIGEDCTLLDAYAVSCINGTCIVDNSFNWDR
jgi:hypothetical protein